MYRKETKNKYCLTTNHFGCLIFTMSSSAFSLKQRKVDPNDFTTKGIIY